MNWCKYSYTVGDRINYGARFHSIFSKADNLNSGICKHRITIIEKLEMTQVNGILCRLLNLYKLSFPDTRKRLFKISEVGYTSLTHYKPSSVFKMQMLTTKKHIKKSSVSGELKITLSTPFLL